MTHNSITPIIFLDFDGVIRIATSSAGTNPAFCQKRMNMVANIATTLHAKIVITSDWRHAENKSTIDALLRPRLTPLLHEDWSTEICGHRWNEVERWLSKHPETQDYAILEDFAPHFEGCPQAMTDRIALCSNRHGFNIPLIARTISILSPSIIHNINNP